MISIIIFSVKVTRTIFGNGELPNDVLPRAVDFQSFCNASQGYLPTIRTKQGIHKVEPADFFFSNLIIEDSVSVIFGFDRGLPDIPPSFAPPEKNNK